MTLDVVHNQICTEEWTQRDPSEEEMEEKGPDREDDQLCYVRGTTKLH